jgi:hypothetical protein
MLNHKARTARYRVISDAHLASILEAKIIQFACIETWAGNEIPHPNRFWRWALRRMRLSRNRDSDRSGEAGETA